MTYGRPDSPLEWINWLEGKLAVQRAKARKYATYYDSENTNLSFAQRKFAEVFGDLFIGWRDNFCPLIVDSISERLRIQGFRMGPDESADPEASDIWQYNRMAAESNAATIEALMAGSAYIGVWFNEEEDKPPLMTPESPEDVVVQFEPGSRRKRIASMKQFTDDWGVEHAFLWTPDRVYKSIRGGRERTWTDPGNGQANPLGEIPHIPLFNRTRLKQEPFSELAGILPAQDAINKVSADALVASEISAFPLKVLSGIEEPGEGASNEEVEAHRQKMVQIYIDRILTLDSPDAKWGEFAATELKNYVVLIDMLVQHVASQSRVPFHYFLLNGGQAPSGEAITAAEAGLVAKARERMLHFGESWEEAMRMCFKIKGNTAKANAYAAETIWADPEYRSKAQLADSLLKMRELGVPEQQLQEEFGYTPTQIQRFGALREQELAEVKRLASKYGVEYVLGQQKQEPARGEGKPKSAKDKSASTERQKAAA